jgi:hypothetical protein
MEMMVVQAQKAVELYTRGGMNPLLEGIEDKSRETNVDQDMIDRQ